VDFVGIQRSVEFARLRSSHRRFVFPLCVLFFCWYLVYVVLAAYAQGFMSYRVFGWVTVGLVLGVAQFASTGVITLGYLRFARRRIDPQVDAIRNRVAAGAAGAAGETGAAGAARDTRAGGARAGGAPR
jgi:uncharacterized membrane protein (DUF485 family)